MAVAVRFAATSDVLALSRVLADAFYDDPLMMWVLPDEHRRERRLTRMFSALVRYHHLSSGGVEVAVNSEGAERGAATMGGAAIWDPPGKWKQTVWSTLLMGPAMLRALGRRTDAGLAVERSLEAVHPNEPHWYLSAIGTAGSARGGGYGKALLQSRLESCDRERLPAYLESSKADNISYYERFGFEVTAEVAIPGGGPTFYPMWRNPR